MIATNQTRNASLYHQVAFAHWGSTVRPLVVLNPHTDIPTYLREQWEAFPPSEEFMVCCWIGGDIAFLPKRNIIDYKQGVEQGYNATPLSRCSVVRPLANFVDRETQMAVEMMDSMLDDTSEQLVRNVTRHMSFYNAVH